MTRPKLYLRFYGSKRPSSRSPSLSVEYHDRPGAFETMRAYGGRVLAYDRHYARFESSAAGLGQRLRWDARGTTRWVDACLAQSGHKEALLRLAVSFAPAGLPDAMMLFIRKFEPYPASLYASGISVRTATQWKTSLRAGNPQIKSNQYAGAVMSFLEGGRQKPVMPGAFETLFLNAQGFLTEGTVSNVMIVKGGQLRTPGAAAGILRGVTREIVFEAAERAGLRRAETQLTRHDLYTADEAFITTTLSEVMPVVRCDGRAIGTGRPGRASKRIHAEFRALVERYLEVK